MISEFTVTFNHCCISFEGLCNALLFRKLQIKTNNLKVLFIVSLEVKKLSQSSFSCRFGEAKRKIYIYIKGFCKDSAMLFQFRNCR